MKRKIFILFFLLLTAAGVSAQKNDYTKDPGYFDFSAITSFMSGDKGSEIMVEEPLLKMLAKMSGDKDDELSRQFSELKLIRLNSFNIEEKDAENVENKIASIDKELTAKNWDRIVRTKSDSEYTNIYVKTSGSEKFLGIVVTSINHKTKNVSVINVVGSIYPELIGKIAKDFNLPQMDKIKKGMGKGK